MNQNDWLRAALSWRSMGCTGEDRISRLMSKVSGFGLPRAAAVAVAVEAERLEAERDAAERADDQARFAAKLAKVAAECPTCIRDAWASRLSVCCTETPSHWVRQNANRFGWTGKQAVQTATWLGATDADAQTADPGMTINTGDGWGDTHGGHFDD